MEIHQNESSLLPVSSILIILAAIGGAILYNAPLKSLRPFDPKTFSKKIIGIETVESRLWKDPLSLVYNHAQDPHRKDAHDHKTLCKDISRRLILKDNKSNITLMTVFVSGGGHLEERENRRRERIAIVAGLGASGLVPEQSDSIGYLAFDYCKNKPKDPGKTKNTGQSEIRIPFEWFRRNHLVNTPAHDQDYVLVLWIDETLFARKLFSKLGFLFSHLIGKDTSDDQLKRIDFVMFGPASSTTLKNMMLDEISEEALNEWFKGDLENNNIKDQNNLKMIAKILNRLTVYSHRSTVKPELLGMWYEVKRKKVSSNENLKPWNNLKISHTIKEHVKGFTLKYCEEGSSGFKFHTTICRDDELAKTLVEELSLRGVSFESDRDTIVLIGEWDTFYGRTLSMAIESEMEYNNSTGNERGVEIYRLGYLRSVCGEACKTSAHSDNRKEDKPDVITGGD